MQAIKNTLAATALAAVAPMALAHGAGWASLHWHPSDLGGLALVVALSALAFWVARRGGKK